MGNMKYMLNVVLDWEDDKDEIDHFEKLVTDKFRGRGGKTTALKYLIREDMKRKKGGKR